MRIQFLRKSGALEMTRKLFFGKKSGALVLTIRHLAHCFLEERVPTKKQLPRLIEDTSCGAQP